jgi:hypothetical protein
VGFIVAKPGAAQPGGGAELPKRARLPPNRSQGDLRLTGEGDWHMVLRKTKLNSAELGNSGSELLSNSGSRLPYSPPGRANANAARHVDSMT